MKRLVGLALFFIGVGLLIALILPKSLVVALIAAMCLLLGYNLFCCC